MKQRPRIVVLERHLQRWGSVDHARRCAQRLARGGVARDPPGARRLSRFGRQGVLEQLVFYVIQRDR
jgi:hypothetical protein